MSKAPDQTQPTARTHVVQHEDCYKAWCALNDAGAPVAASVRNNPADVPGTPIECLIVVKLPALRPVVSHWQVVEHYDVIDKA